MTPWAEAWAAIAAMARRESCILSDVSGRIGKKKMDQSEGKVFRV
jgi:hypothetical protein